MIFVFIFIFSFNAYASCLNNFPKSDADKRVAGQFPNTNYLKICPVDKAPCACGDGIVDFQSYDVVSDGKGGWKFQLNNSKKSSRDLAKAELTAVEQADHQTYAELSLKIDSGSVTNEEMLRFLKLLKSRVRK